MRIGVHINIAVEAYTETYDVEFYVKLYQRLKQIENLGAQIEYLTFFLKYIHWNILLILINNGNCIFM
jgi:hypothetical protein